MKLGVIMPRIFVVPVENLVIDNPFRMGKMVIYPAVIDSDICNSWNEQNNGIKKQDNEYYCNIINKINSKFRGNTAEVYIMYLDAYDYDKCDTLQKQFWYCDSICNFAINALNYLILSECVLGVFEQLPGLPGMNSQGIKVVYTFYPTEDPENEIEIISGKVASELRTGIGCYPSIDFGEEDYDSTWYKILYSENIDNEVQKICKTALEKICKAFYITDFNICFTYLWTILESIASDEYLQFKKVKSRILPFISRDKKEYHDKGEWLRNLSESTRTNIVHNGISIYELYETEAEVLQVLRELQSVIMTYVENIYATNITNLDDLEKKRTELIKYLGV